jgi:branched-chain amino acid aminotransferase
VTPVGELRSPGSVTPAPASTDLTMQIRDALVGMQFGRSEDTFGWMHRVC